MLPRVSYDELKEMVRKKLKQTSADIPELTLKGLWCDLDADNSNEIEINEFRKFAELGALEGQDASKNFGGLNKQTAASLSGGLSALTSAAAIASQPTAEMRAELLANGHELPSDVEMKSLSRRFNEALDRLRKSDGTKSQGALNWMTLFRQVRQIGPDRPRSAQIGPDRP